MDLNYFEFRSSYYSNVKQKTQQSVNVYQDFVEMCLQTEKLCYRLAQVVID